MRKIASIFLILLLAFNWYGYRVVISVLNQNADTKLETRIDNSDYDESQLIEIKVALNMPYQERFTDFERHYGQIEIDGKSYTYVKRKIDGDVVIFKCISNESKQQLKAINNDLAKANSSADMDNSGKQQQKNSSAGKNLLSDYDDQNFFRQFAALSAQITPASFNYSFFIHEVSLNTPHQPPDAIAVLS